MNSSTKATIFLLGALTVVPLLLSNAHAGPADSAVPPRKPQGQSPAGGAATNATGAPATTTRTAGAPGTEGAGGLTRLQETVKQRKATLGPDHRDTLAAMRSLAMAYLATGRNAEALKLSDETVTISKTKLGIEHPDTLFALSALAQANVALKQYTNAEPHWREILKASHKVGATSATSRPLADALLGLGECLLRQGKPAEAEPLLREGLPLMEKHQPGLSPTFTAQTLLGWALLGQKKYAEAEPLLLKGYQGLKERDAKRPSPSRTLAIQETGEHIVQLYEASGKPDQAAEWKKRLSASKPVGQ